MLLVIPTSRGISPCQTLNFSAGVRSTRTSGFAVIAVDSPSSCAWDRMEAAGRPIPSSAWTLLANLRVEGCLGTLARRPPCRRCLHTLRAEDRYLKTVASLSAARIRRGVTFPCSFWHDEARRRRLVAPSARPFATVREGMLFHLLK